MKEPIRLNRENLKFLTGKVACPDYDRKKISAGIVHIGVGGFHRSHQAYYTDSLMNISEASGWGICGVGLKEGDRKMRDILKEQDYLYTLILRYPDGKTRTRIIGSLVDFLLGSDDPGKVIDRLAGRHTRIVSLTITEGGYNMDPATGEFDFSNPDVQHDLKNPLNPRLVFGYLTAALKKRFTAGMPAFTIQSCDNLQHNGDITRKMLLSFAVRQDPELARWIEEENDDGEGPDGLADPRRTSGILDCRGVAVRVWRCREGR